jgi:hypothetical protein
VLGMLQPDCPGAAHSVLESFGIRAEPFRQAFVLSMGDPWETTPPTGRSRQPPSSCWSGPTWRPPGSPTPRSPASMSCSP